MARNVKDAATFLSAMAGKSELDPLTDEIPFEKIPDYALSCATTNLKGIRIGVPTSLIGKLELEEAKGFEVAISVLETLGLQSSTTWLSWPKNYGTLRLNYSG